jgi:hypothetical protein
MVVTSTPTLAISIRPETLENANNTIQQAFGIGFDDIAVAFVILSIVLLAIRGLIKRIQQI